MAKERKVLCIGCLLYTSTILDAKGGYTNQDKNVMLVVVNQKKQEVALKKMVKELDEKSFIIVTDVYEVLGKGFKSIDV